MNDTRNPHTRGPARRDPAFERRVAFLAQSFTGIDWATRPPLSPEDIERYVEEGRGLRAQALASLLRRGATSSAHVMHRGLRAAIDAGRALAGVIVRARKRRAAIRELMALNDHTLKDIGLHRSQIRSVVEEMFNTPAPSPGHSVTLAEMAGTRRKAGESAVNDDDFESAA